MSGAYIVTGALGGHELGQVITRVPGKAKDKALALKLIKEWSGGRLHLCRTCPAVGAPSFGSAEALADHLALRHPKPKKQAATPPPTANTSPAPDAPPTAPPTAPPAPPASAT